MITLKAGCFWGGLKKLTEARFLAHRAEGTGIQMRQDIERRSHFVISSPPVNRKILRSTAYRFSSHAAGPGPKRFVQRCLGRCSRGGWSLAVAKISGFRQVAAEKIKYKSSLVWLTNLPIKTIAHPRLKKSPEFFTTKPKSRHQSPA